MDTRGQRLVEITWAIFFYIMNKEIFKDILGYEGIYQVSNLGNVKSLSREKLVRGKHPAIIKGKILNPINNGKGYYRVPLYKDGKPKNISIHILVAQAFLGHIPDGTHKIEVDHKNGIKSDNRVENLQLLTGVEHRRKTAKNMKNSSKYTGVCWDKKANKWMAQIKIDGKNKYLGYFTDEYEAHLEYQKALEMYNNGDLSFLKPKKYSSQYKGVSWNKKSNKWQSSIYIDGKKKYLGLFENEYDAHLAYEKALSELK
jgi:hypothetical protein